MAITTGMPRSGATEIRMGAAANRERHSLLLELANEPAEKSAQDTLMIF